MSQNVYRRLTHRFDAFVGMMQNWLIRSNSAESRAKTWEADRGNGHDDYPTQQRNDRAAEQLVIPRERVLKLLAENGGEMKQGDIVSSVDWSESTVSRKLCKLESAGEIVRYRIGREKLVFLPGAVPDTFDSPLTQNDEPPRLTA